jgi:hypothetical protein
VGNVPRVSIFLAQVAGHPEGPGYFHLVVHQQGNPADKTPFAEAKQVVLPPVLAAELDHSHPFGGQQFRLPLRVAPGSVRDPIEAGRKVHRLVL